LRHARITGTLLTVVSASCTTTIVEPYYRPESAQIEQSYLRPGVEFGKYTRILPTPLEIYYPDNVPRPSDEDLNRVRVYFREAFLEALGDDYRVTYEAGPDTLRIRAQIIDLKITGAGGRYEPGGRLRSLIAAGQLTFLMEAEDSLTSQVLARAAESTNAGVSEGGDDASWDEVRAAAEIWARLFRNWLDANLSQARLD
jgi:hypothetical protein